VLNVFRVRRPGLKPKAPVMFFMHGILDSADAWVMNFEEGSPAFIAAARGYDVWCGNSRGSRFSRKHETYDADSFWNRTSKFNFWNFSFQEMAEKDGPAFLDKVLNVTGAKTVTWVGHG
jgi:lysosomal acid lipase/cholesteryl ester hydrolase